jgi:hypothetical protein
VILFRTHTHQLRITVMVQRKEISMQIWTGKLFSIRQIGMIVYTKLVMSSFHIAKFTFTWDAPDGITLNVTDHILTNRRRQSSIPDVLYFRGDDCDTDRYLVVAKL